MSYSNNCLTTIETLGDRNPPPSWSPHWQKFR